MDFTCRSVVHAVKHESAPKVQNLVACFEEDKDSISAEFSQKVILKESIHDFFQSNDKRKLPVLREILSLAHTHGNGDFIIYSNADIALMPNFYYAVNKILENGYDSLIINRRRISNVFLNESDLEMHYAEAGAAHPGFDCFVFKKDLIPQLELENVCTGIPHAENLLAHNLFIKTNYCKLITDAHLTFHIGMVLHNDWGTKAQFNFNKKQFISRLQKMRKDIRIENFPGAELSFFKRHYKWLMNPSFHYPTMFKADFSQWSKPRRKNDKKEKLDRKNRYFERLIKRINFD
ncbi:MAG: hypothetical protein ACHQF2_00370 [Flavobacteriales bacterium]